MLRIVLIQPGSTLFDEQGRIKGSLDIPLSSNGTGQVARTVEELADHKFDAIYASPNQSALQTAYALAQERKMRVKSVRKLRNIDHGLWQGRLIDEVKLHQPKVYRQCQDHSETVCLPQGESIVAARQRAHSVLTKIVKRHKHGGTVALVVPEPLASVVSGLLRDDQLENLWQAERDCGDWTVIEFPPAEVSVGG